MPALPELQAKTKGLADAFPSCKFSTSLVKQLTKTVEVFQRALRSRRRREREEKETTQKKKVDQRSMFQDSQESKPGIRIPSTLPWISYPKQERPNVAKPARENHVLMQRLLARWKGRSSPSNGVVTGRRLTQEQQDLALQQHLITLGDMGANSQISIDIVRVY